jgi:hypothetical protein
MSSPIAHLAVDANANSDLFISLHFSFIYKI